MLSHLRRRLNSEGGISLVETLVAMMILSISMLAMLNTFVASAHATLQQRMRAAQTRVATSELERLRSIAWTPTFPASPATVSTTTTVDGRSFTITSDVTNDPTTPNLKHVVTNVTCTQCRGTQTLRTSVTSGQANADTVATNAFMTLALAPNPVRVFENTCTIGYWCPGAPVSVTATVEGVSYSGQLQLAWTNSNGVARTLMLSKTGTTWTGSIPAADVLVTFPTPQDLERTLQFNLTAPGMPSLAEKQYQLSMLGYDDIALSLNIHNYGYASDPVRRTQVRVDWQNDVQQCGSSACRNMDNLILWVTNVQPDATSVALTWQQPVVNTTLNLIKHSTPGVWYANVGTNGAAVRRWYPGGPGTLLNALPVNATVRIGTTVVLQSALSVPVWTAR